jgi:hypothetical protein
MRDEMEAHIELYEADLRKAGLPPAETRRRARLEFGSAAARQDECREAHGDGSTQSSLRTEIGSLIARADVATRSGSR